MQGKTANKLKKKDPDYIDDDDDNCISVTEEAEDNEDSDSGFDLTQGNTQDTIDPDQQLQHGDDGENSDWILVDTDGFYGFCYICLDMGGKDVFICDTVSCPSPVLQRPQRQVASAHKAAIQAR